MNLSEARNPEGRNRSLHALGESRDERQAATLQDDCSASLPAASTIGTEQSTDARDAMAKDLIETDLIEARARALQALDRNRNQRQITVLLAVRGDKLLEESQSLMQQCIQFRDTIRGTCERVVSRSFALLSRGKAGDESKDSDSKDSNESCNRAA